MKAAAAGAAGIDIPRSKARLWWRVAICVETLIVPDSVAE
jgi:hypothetical protein